MIAAKRELEISDWPIYKIAFKICRSGIAQNSPPSKLSVKAHGGKVGDFILICGTARVVFRYLA